MKAHCTFLFVAWIVTDQCNEVLAQWCVPPTLVPYSADMPGITQFQLNTIDRTSEDLENYPNNSYVHTGLSTDLIAGQSYPVTIQFTVHQIICPDMNLRVWIDLNHDGQLDDTGETLLSVDHVSPSTYSGSIIIPENAMLGTTRMRVTAKMSSLGGHSLPTPCDFPADPLGYHGEMEDYEVNILSATGIDDLASSISSVRVIYSDRPILQYEIAAEGDLRISIYNATGSIISESIPVRSVRGKNERDLPMLTSGVYFVQLRMDGAVVTVPYIWSR